MNRKRARESAAATRRWEEIRRRCREHRVALTDPRRAILEAVLGAATHPTADEVHALAVRRRPGIGRATVYRALEVFVRIGVLGKAGVTASSVRYDPRLDRHHHLVCVRCDRVVDLDDPRLDALPVPDTSALGFAVHDLHVQVRGVCRSCRRKKEES